MMRSLGTVRGVCFLCGFGHGGSSNRCREIRRYPDYDISFRLKRRMR